MKAPFKFPLPARLLAATALGASGLLLSGALWPAPYAAAPQIEAAFVSPAAARAIGARWRENQRDETGRQYAQALLAAGLSDELLGAVETDGLFAGDPDARALFRAEALLRLYRHQEAAREVSGPALADNPYAAFIRVRARAGAGGGLDRDALALATRGPAELAREAWLLRARAALDENDFATADASLKRAAETGATTARTEPFAIERDVRAGLHAAAAAALDKRAKSLARMAADRGETIPDYEGLRLAAMLALRLDDGRGASRLADRASLGTPGGDDAPLAAFAKWIAGDTAQAEAILGAHLRAAPGDFVARDLAAALAYAGGKDAEGDAHLNELAIEHPRLAAFRRFDRARKAGGFDKAYSCVDALSGEGPLMGAAAALLGSGAPIEGLPEPVDADLALAALAGATDQRSARAAAAKLLGLRRSAIDLAAAAAALARNGADDDAAALAFDAGRAAFGFFAPVALRAGILETMGRGAEALGQIEVFAAAHPGHAPARLYRARLLLRLDDVEASATAFAAIEPSLVFAEEEAALDYARAAATVGEPWRQVMLDAAATGSLPRTRLAHVLEAAGEDAGAAAAYRDALVDDPGSADLAKAYREVMARQGRAGDADALLETIARRHPGEPVSAAALEPELRENANL